MCFALKYFDFLNSFSYYQIMYNSTPNENNDYLIDFQFINEPMYVKDIRLVQVGKKFCNQNTVVFEHTHIDWFELTIILDGKGTINTNKHSATVQEGDIYLSYPCDIHSIISDSNSPMKYAFLSFCLDRSPFKEDFDKIAFNFHESNKRIFTNPFIPQLVEALISEMTTESFEKEEVLYSCLNQILIYTCRAFLHNKLSSPTTSVGKNEILCYKIMRYIDNNIFTIQNLTDIANHLNYNYSYLAKVFKNTTHNTLAQYVAKRKMERAKIMIKEGVMNFTKIAEMLNYSSIYSFSKSFKVHFGIPPADYKKQHSKTKKDTI